MLVSLYRLQNTYCIKLGNSATGFGPYVLTDNINNCCMRHDGLPPSDTDITGLVNAIRDRLSSNREEAIPSVVSVIADELLVSHVPSQAAFVVSVKDGPVQAVKLFPAQLCTCPAKKILLPYCSSKEEYWHGGNKPF